jgi:hypothetical protein
MTGTTARIERINCPRDGSTSGGAADTWKGWRHGKRKAMRGRPASVHPGERYGRLVVIEETDLGVPKGGRTFRCRCDCGGEWVGVGSGLRTGHTRSCGCLQSEHAERMARTQDIQTTHGLSRHPDYVAWQSMVRRCTDQRTKDWARYGGKGITVCERWRESFAFFHEDMGSRPERGWHLHRVDNSRGYEPGNCEWISPSEHGRLHAASRREASA